MRDAIRFPRAASLERIIRDVCLEDVAIEFRRRDGMWEVLLLPHSRRWIGAYGEHPDDFREALITAVEEMVSSSTPWDEGRARAP